MEENYQTYYGLAGKNGVESFEWAAVDTYGFGVGRNEADVNLEQFTMCVKATADTANKLVLYKVDMTDDDSQMIMDLVYGKSLKEKNVSLEALKIIKERGKLKQVASWGITKAEAKKRWDSITAGL